MRNPDAELPNPLSNGEIWTQSPVRPDTPTVLMDPEPSEPLMSIKKRGYSYGDTLLGRAQRQAAVQGRSQKQLKRKSLRAMAETDRQRQTDRQTDRHSLWLMQ